MFDTYSTEGPLEGASREWDFYVASGYERTGGWRHATLGKNYDGFVNIGHLGPTRGICFQGLDATSYLETAGSLPQTIFETFPRTNFTPGDFRDLDLLQFAFLGICAARLWPRLRHTPLSSAQRGALQRQSDGGSKRARVQQKPHVRWER